MIKGTDRTIPLGELHPFKDHPYKVEDNADLSAALEESEKESTVKKLQKLRLHSDYERIKGILDRILPEIFREYTHHDSKTQEVPHYR